MTNLTRNCKDCSHARTRHGDIWCRQGYWDITDNPDALNVASILLEVDYCPDFDSMDNEVEDGS